MKLKSAPITTILLIRKFVMNGKPNPKGIRSRIFRSEVFTSSGVSVISGRRFKLFPAPTPFNIRFDEKYFRRSKD
jgi:hypothetical protein